MMECNLKNEICGFSCTGFNGNKVWSKLHNLHKDIDCEECADHAKRLFEFIHDVVNAGLGKPLHNEKNFNQIYNEIQCVYNKTVGEPA